MKWFNFHNTCECDKNDHSKVCRFCMAKLERMNENAQYESDYIDAFDFEYIETKFVKNLTKLKLVNTNIVKVDFLTKKKLN